MLGFDPAVFSTIALTGSIAQGHQFPYLPQNNNNLVLLFKAPEHVEHGQSGLEQ